MFVRRQETHQGRQGATSWSIRAATGGCTGTGTAKRHGGSAGPPGGGARGPHAAPLPVHKRAFFSFLRERWATLFDARFDVLLYDLTSTCFESDPPFAGKRQFGYSRDKRPDCVQVVIALVDAAGLPAGLGGDVRQHQRQDAASIAGPLLPYDSARPMGWIKTTFHKTGSPRWFFTGARPWVVGLYVFGALLIVVGSTWGLGFVPPERLQGDSVRILFIHAPAAHLAEAIYVAIAIAGFVFLVWRMKMADMLIQAAAPIGFVVTVLALATGIIWGIPTWGTGWVWDARTVSTLLLAFLFFGLVALRQAIGREDRASRAVALLALVGVINIPIIKYSVEWFTTLHQPPSIVIGEKPAIAPVFLIPLAVNVVGFYCFVAGVVIAALRARIAEREAGTQWLRDWMSKS